MGTLDDVMDEDQSQSDSYDNQYNTAGAGPTDYDYGNLAKAFENVTKTAEQSRAMLKQARSRILSEKYNNAIPLLAMSAALGAPTRAGSTAESFAAMNQSLIEPLREKAAFKRQQEKDVFGVDSALIGLDEKLAQSGVSLESLKAKLAAQAGNAPLEKVILNGQHVLLPRSQARNKEFFVPPAASTNVNLNTEKNLYGKLGDKQAEVYSTMWNTARTAPEMASRAQRIREAVQKNPYTGSLADYKLALGKGLQSVGVTFAKDAATNTEQLAVEMARSTLDSIKSSGLAGSQGLTEGERKFLERAVAGQITLEPKTILQLANLNERAARISAKAWNDQLGRLDPEQMKILGMTPVDMATASAPQVIPWDSMPSPPAGNGGNAQSPPKQDIIRWQDWPPR